MASTLNLDWVLGLAEQIAGSLGVNVEKDFFLKLVDDWIVNAQPASLLYHPYISNAGERGPFIDHTASSSFLGLSSNHLFGDLVRGTIEGLGFAARDCYTAMGKVPQEVRLTGGAARSKGLREILSATLGTPVRQSTREETGASGAAMIAAVSLGVFNTMDLCLEEWVTPMLDEQEKPVLELTNKYNRHFPKYISARQRFSQFGINYQIQRDTEHDAKNCDHW